MRLALSTAIVLTSSLASAQPADVSERFGLFGGGGLYGGNIQCDGNECGDDFREAGGLNGQIGFMITPNLGLLLDGWAMRSDKNDVSITYAAATIGARLWVVPRLWLQGAIGNGHARVEVSAFDGNLMGESQTDNVPVGEIGLGVEVARGAGWALDINARVAQGTKTDAIGDGTTTGRMVGVGASVSFFMNRTRAR